MVKNKHKSSSRNSEKKHNDKKEYLYIASGKTAILSAASAHAMLDQHRMKR